MIERFEDFAAFERFLQRPGRWVAGFDFPFAQARKFLAGIGWPGTDSWPGYVEHVGRLTRAEFRRDLIAYRSPRPAGDRHHHRSFDRLCAAQSPQVIDYTPVGMMFFEGAPRLLHAGVHLPGLRAGDRDRVCVEAYPGVAARALAGRESYKADAARRQTAARHAQRRRIFAALTGDAGAGRFGGLRVAAWPGLAEDPTGDSLDALICAVQAAWALRAGLTGAGPRNGDPLEGWIADPDALAA